MRQSQERSCAIKVEITDPGAGTFEFRDHRPMCSGKATAVADRIFLFAGENERGWGLVAHGRLCETEFKVVGLVV